MEDPLDDGDEGPDGMIAEGAIRIAEVPVLRRARMRPRLRMTRRTSRGMTPTAAIPVPAVKPRPSDLARV